jgi:cell wall-associated NlpC family hydrolase
MNMHALRLLLLPCAAALIAAGCASTGAVPRPFPGAPVAVQPAPAVAPPAELPSERIAEPEPIAVGEIPPPATSPGSLALAQALQFQGVRYKNGGSDPTGFDCSGLVQYVFARQGIAMPREVRLQYQVGYDVDATALRPGDLLFFETESNGASHVAIAVDGESFVHAPNSRGVVRVERLATSYWSRRFLGARRIE